MDLETLMKENEMLKQKLNHTKEYKKNYYQTKCKQKKHYCPVCDKYMNISSKANHNEGKKHQNKMFEIGVKQIDEFYSHLDLIEITEDIYNSIIDETDEGFIDTSDVLAVITMKIRK